MGKPRWPDGAHQSALGLAAIPCERPSTVPTQLARGRHTIRSGGYLATSLLTAQLGTARVPAPDHLSSHYSRLSRSPCYRVLFVRTGAIQYLLGISFASFSSSSVNPINPIITIAVHSSPFAANPQSRFGYQSRCPPSAGPRNGTSRPSSNNLTVRPLVRFTYVLRYETFSY